MAYMMPHKLKAMKRKAGFDEEIQTEDQSQLWNWQIVFWVFCMEMVGQQVRKARMYGIFRNITLRRKQANEDSNYKVG